MDLSVVIPVFNERDNLRELVQQVFAALENGPDFELVLVNDGSTDDSQTELEKLAAERPITVVCHPVNAGQSAALCSGAAAARGHLMATLDGDLQNDPADIPRLMDAMSNYDQPVLVAGNRVNRRDTWVRRTSSRMANSIRQWALQDGCPDTGCSLKLFRREDFLRLPQFNHMHRFLPALFAAHGISTVNVPVNHRPRVAGVSKYGISNRLWVGIMDMLGVRWLRRRSLGVNAAQPEKLKSHG